MSRIRYNFNDWFQYLMRVHIRLAYTMYNIFLVVNVLRVANMRTHISLAHTVCKCPGL
ncbi:hypothetical protein Krac_10167 [Ktedonobacter racemifer DSM 44963]|uniref:Uncharacterized protein n=1 Tax=Ktedonobacter racemifer DSM 44963 TaxID=485913 RepID=D6TFK3_KTERA|nr:hypothetical protein Krac_10167 [Ktedonobacter racemifer DSM 44963]